MTPPLSDQTNLLPRAQLLLVFSTLSVVLACAIFDQTCVSTAIPSITASFKGSSQGSWVSTAYLLTDTASQPLYGRLSDIFGRKNCLLCALVIFLVGNAICAASQSMIQLIVFRAFQGLGGGGLISLSTIIVGDIIALRDRAKYQGILGAVIAVCQSLGPLLGGALSEKGGTLGWRWIFIFQVPLTLISILIVSIFIPLKNVPGDRKTKLKQIDYTGIILLFTGTLALLIPLSWAGGQFLWSSVATILPLVLGVILAITFFWWESVKALYPILPCYLFTNKSLSACYFATAANGAIQISIFFYFPQLFQITRQSSPIQSGLYLIPYILPNVIVSFASGWLASKINEYRYSILSGFALWTIAQGLLSMTSLSTSIVQICAFLAMAGIGAGQTTQTSLLAIQASVGREDMAVATSARSFFRSIGGVFWLAVCQAIINNTLRSRLSGVSGIPSAEYSLITNDPLRIVSPESILDAGAKAYALESYAAGFRNVLISLIPWAGLSFVLLLLFLKKHSLDTPSEGQITSHKHHPHTEKDSKGSKKISTLADVPPKLDTAATVQSNLSVSEQKVEEVKIGAVV